MTRAAPYLGARRTDAGDVNVTPMIDVVMCLIVFYLIVGHLVEEQRSEVDLPDAATGEPDRPAQPLVINVIAGEAGPRIVIDGRELGRDELRFVLDDLGVQRPESVVQLRADERLTYEAISDIVKACRDAGVPSIELATENIP